MKKNTALALGILAVIVFFGLYFFDQKENSGEILGCRTVKIAEREFRVERLTREAERAEGLSGRAALLGDEGMIFEFPKKHFYGFWMKDMNFSIDIIFLDGKKVVTILPNVSPQTYPETFYPTLPADTVLELPAGAGLETGLATGEEIFISEPKGC